MVQISRQRDFRPDCWTWWGRDNIFYGLHVSRPRTLLSGGSEPRKGQSSVVIPILIQQSFMTFITRKVFNLDYDFHLTGSGLKGCMVGQRRRGAIRLAEFYSEVGHWQEFSVSAVWSETKLDLDDRQCLCLFEERTIRPPTTRTR